MNEQRPKDLCSSGVTVERPVSVINRDTGFCLFESGKA